MKYLTLSLLLLVLSACTYTVQATPAELAAYNAMVATREANLLPTVTPTPQPPAPTIEPNVLPDCLFKVNRSSSGELIYHPQDGASFDSVIIEPEKGEFCTDDEQAAIDAGARKALR